MHFDNENMVPASARAGDLSADGLTAAPTARLLDTGECSETGEVTSKIFACRVTALVTDGHVWVCVHVSQSRILTVVREELFTSNTRSQDSLKCFSYSECLLPTLQDWRRVCWQRRRREARTRSRISLAEDTESSAKGR